MIFNYILNLSFFSLLFLKTNNSNKELDSIVSIINSSEAHLNRVHWFFKLKWCSSWSMGDTNLSCIGGTKSLKCSCYCCPIRLWCNSFNKNLINSIQTAQMLVIFFTKCRKVAWIHIKVESEGVWKHREQ